VPEAIDRRQRDRCQVSYSKTRAMPASRWYRLWQWKMAALFIVEWAFD
jgi:hypothetical protein